MTNIVDENGDPGIDFDTRDIKARKCKKSDFKIDTEYFHGLSYLTDLYCMDNPEDLFVN